MPNHDSVAVAQWNGWAPLEFRAIVSTKGATGDQASVFVIFHAEFLGSKALISSGGFPPRQARVGGDYEFRAIKSHRVTGARGECPGVSPGGWCLWGDYMSTREELLGLLRELIEREGPGVTLRQFERETGISVRQVYRRWGDWKSLSRAAGQPERGRPGVVHTDGVLLAELNRVSAACGEFPTKAAFDRLSSFCWGTIERRFGKRPAVWERYREWLVTQGEEARPAFLRGVDLAGDGAAIPGVTSHASAEARQKAIEEYDEMLAYLDPSLLGPPPAGWKPAKAKWGEVEAPGGSTGAKRRTLELGAEEALTPEEWNAFYNHPLAVPIVDIGAGLFPEMLRDRDPRDRRPNPPPWERDLESRWGEDLGR